MRNWKRNYLYRIDVIPTGEFYYGIHSTDIDEEHDVYWGSGSLIRNRVKKYGKQNCPKTIIEYFNNRKQLSRAEALWIQDDLLKEEKCLNLALGGDFGITNNFDGTYPEAIKKRLKEEWHLTHHPHTEETRKKMSESHKGEKNYLYGKKHTQEWKDKLREKYSRRFKVFNPELQKEAWAYPETVEALEAKGYIRGTGPTKLPVAIWMHRPGGEARKFLREEYDQRVAEGWIRGKKFDHSALGAGGYTKRCRGLYEKCKTG